MRKSACCPECTVVKLIGNINKIENADIHLNGGEAQRASFGLYYEDGKLAMLMSQRLNGEVNSVIVDMQLDENDMISRIDLCMPELFKFEHFAGPFATEQDEPITQETIEEMVRNLLVANPDSFEELDDLLLEIAPKVSFL